MNDEPRSFSRKLIHGQTIVALDDGGRCRGRARDISPAGLSMLLPVQLPVGTTCTTALETTSRGKVVYFAARAKITYCILSGTEGFRVGLQFVQVDAGNNRILAELTG